MTLRDRNLANKVVILFAELLGHDRVAGNQGLTQRLPERLKSSDERKVCIVGIRSFQIHQVVLAKACCPIHLNKFFGKYVRKFCVGLRPFTGRIRSHTENRRDPQTLEK